MHKPFSWYHGVVALMISTVSLVLTIIFPASIAAITIHSLAMPVVMFVLLVLFATGLLPEWSFTWGFALVPTIYRQALIQLLAL